MKIKNYKKAIKTIIEFRKAFSDIDPKVPKKLVGEIGEFYALQQFERLGLKPEHKGGHGGYDIYLHKIEKRIEVRTSLLKNEGVFPNGINFYGWRVENRNQKKSEKFDYLICIALDDNFVKPRFYIFTYQEAFKVGNVNIGRFGNVKKKIQLFENKQTYRNALKSKQSYLITEYEQYINRNPSYFQNKWKKIK